MSRLASVQAKFAERVNRGSLRRPFPWLVVIVTAAFALVPLWRDDVQLRESLLLACVYITLASNLNLMIGYAGYVNFGNIVFFGLGGYICVYLIDTWHWPLLVAALAAGLGVSAVALVFGLGILRLRGAFQRNMKAEGQAGGGGTDEECTTAKSWHVGHRALPYAVAAE